LKVDGKPIDVIWGIKVEDGERKAYMQSMRYPRDKWTAAEARQHCRKHGGSFEPAAPKEKSAQKSIEVGMLYRSERVDPSAVDSDARRITLTFSSEQPVKRWFGYEVLDHKESSVSLSRLKEAGNLLLNHDPDKVIGVIEDVWVDKKRKRGVAVVRFGKSSLAEEVWKDVQEGVWRNVSVGYMIHEMVLEKEEGEEQFYRVTNWEPLEVSIVAVPADHTVGVGRAETKTEVKVMMSEQVNPVQEPQPEIREEKPRVQVDESEIRKQALETERKRISEIMAIGQQHKCVELAQKAIADGTSVDEFRAVVLEKVYGARKIEPIDPTIGLSKKEARQFSFVRAIRAMATGDWSQAEFEREVSRATAEKIKREPRGIFVPYDVLTIDVGTRRDLTKSGDGGNLVATELVTGEFIELLRNAMMVRKLGARVLSGLVGDVAIPKQTGGATAYWVTEGNAPSESQQTFAQLALTPKTVGAFTDISRKLLLQSSMDVEQLVREDLATVLALAIDYATIAGTGSGGQPTGVINTSGIGVVAIGSDGGAPTYTHILNLWKTVAQNNAATGRLGWLTNAIMIAKLASTEKFSGTGKTVIEDLPGPDGMTTMLGVPCAMSNQVPSNLTKGSSNDCSAIIFGNWRDLVIAEWGALDLLVDPYTGGTAGTVRVRVLQDVDIGIRHVESFAAILDARDV